MHPARTTATIAALNFAIAALVGPSFAQSAKDLVGSYTLVSAVMDLNGKKNDTYGPNAKGALTLDANGRFVVVFMRANLPKFASNSRMTGTPEENQAIVRGSFASLGTYSINEADKTIIFRIENATFPNWNGDEQKRSFTVSGDELKYVVAAASGGGIATVTWKHTK
jgi:lipocalin-like protein